MNRQQKYEKTDKGKKARTKTSWKRQGLDMSNFEEIYELYLDTTNCQKCNILFINDGGGSKKCMDHCHDTGMFRNVICSRCNNRLPKQTPYVKYDCEKCNYHSICKYGYTRHLNTKKHLRLNSILPIHIK
tara:strand:+ start:213 stop:602 length:390 start_codon:yes stop_codon:yes gene_type:complete